MIDKARLWYLKQINLIEEKQKYVGKTSHNVGSHHSVVFIRIEKGHI